jgi:serine/threonine protein kinase
MFHFDIKTENIMYSPSLKKLIYIDFNLTQMKKAEFGFKILSRFRGTLNFCYEEMFHLYSV